MASVFLYHVVGDLTVGKPELVEFSETQTVEAAIKAIGESTECGIPVWKIRSQKSVIENSEMRAKRFVGILTSLDIVAFLAREECLVDQEKAMKTPVSEVVVPDPSLLKELDPATRYINCARSSYSLLCQSFMFDQGVIEGCIGLHVLFYMKVFDFTQSLRCFCLIYYYINVSRRTMN